MPALIEGGGAAALVLIVLVAEAALLARRHRAGRGGLPPRQAVFLILPGFAFVAALQAALSGLHWSAIAIALLAAFVTHLLDLRERLKR
jgi:hypothetical protein